MSLFFLSICRSQYPVEFATWIRFGSTWIHKKIHLAASEFSQSLESL